MQLRVYSNIFTQQPKFSKGAGLKDEEIEGEDTTTIESTKVVSDFTCYSSKLN